MRRSKLRLIVCSICLVMAYGKIASAQWSPELQLPSEKNPTPAPATNTEKPALAFPTNADEIAKSLANPPKIPKIEGARGLGGIVYDETKYDEYQKVGALILFDSNSAAIKEESLELLREYGKAFEGALKDAVIVVGGHTDSKGTNDYNLTLSKQRAESVKNFLMSEFQIPEKHLVVQAFGENKPIESNDSDEGRAKNRRVEFIRIK